MITDLEDREDVIMYRQIGGKVDKAMDLELGIPEFKSGL